ncbi:MAG: serine/threonine-protein kinase [Myxococcota bacterium]
MLAPLDYDRYRIIDEVVRLPTLRILWAEVDGRRVQLVTSPPVPQTGRLTVLRRLAEREVIGVDGVCPYLASGVDEQRTWVAFAAPDAPTLSELADAIARVPSLANPVAAARIVADAAVALREVVRLAPSLPAGGLDDLRVGTDGKVVIGFLGEILPEPRLEEQQVVAELGRWLDRLGGRNSPLHVLAAGIGAGSIRRLGSLAEELEGFIEAQGGVTHSAVGAWVRRQAEATPAIAPPLLIDDPTNPEPLWVQRTPDPSTPVPSGRSSLSGPIGAVIGGYRLVKRVGNGMMGRVYEAVRASDDRRVALKLMMPADDDPEMLAEYRNRFHREVEALARLSHPNIVRILEFGYDDEGWLSMEYVDGSTLSKVLRSCGHMPPLDVVTIARQLCAALGHAHTHGVIHRDLKPGNVILEADDPARVRLVDFGLAKEWDGTAESTNDGTLMGTPHYMSPEQCRGEAARVESDVYALGMLMYRLLTGRMPFENERGAAIFIAHLKAPVPTFASLGLPFDIPPGIEVVVRKCLEKRPEDRFRSALAVDFALRGCLEASSQPSRPRQAGSVGDQLSRGATALREGVDQLVAAGRRTGPRGLAAAALAALLLGVLLVGGASSATVVWVVSSITGGSDGAGEAPADDAPTVPNSLRAVEVPPIPAEDHPPVFEVPDDEGMAPSAFEPSRTPGSRRSARIPRAPVSEGEPTPVDAIEAVPEPPSSEPSASTGGFEMRQRRNKEFGG